MPFLGAITSADNEHIRYARSLHNKRARYQEKRFFIEGLRLVAQALHEGYRPVLAFLTPEFAASDVGARLAQELVSGETRVWQVTPQVLATLSDTKSPQGIVAVAGMPNPVPQRIQQASLLLVLDDLRDPGNLGTILRTAQATGVEAILLSEGCVDAYAPKVVRAGMGAHFQLPLFVDMTWPAIRDALAGKQRILADAAGTYTPWDLDWRQPTALLIGNEAQGAGPEARALADLTVRLPMAPIVESLNASIATAVLLFEAMHQRSG
ncbi:MAG: TrmH family RNA methyltransferase [Anaerolineae bacterium]